MRKSPLVIFFVVFITLGLCIQINAQSPSSYYPIQVGNKYVYENWDLFLSCNPFHFLSYKIVTISSDTIFQNGKKYYKFSGYWDSRYTYQRVDTNSWNVYYYDIDSTSEFLLDSLLAHAGDHFNGRRNPAAVGNRPYVNTEGITNYFGQPRGYKHILADGLVVLEYTLVEGIGLVRTSFCELGGGDGNILKGCLINGVLYGDTTLTTVQNISSNIPASVRLHNNYPNPFNPSTTIEFEIPKRNKVTIKVYDILGKEVAVLVDKVVEAGVYRTFWDASDFSSGVYLYKLESSGFTQTKKMLIVK